MTRHLHPRPTPPPEDPALLHFLQDHAAAPPPPAPELEDRIMTAIRSEPMDRAMDLGTTTTVPLWQQRTIWLPTAVVAGVALVWISMQGLISPEPALTVAEQAELELFLERAWSGAIEGADGADLTI